MSEIEFELTSPITDVTFDKNTNEIIFYTKDGMASFKNVNFVKESNSSDDNEIKVINRVEHIKDDSKIRFYCPKCKSYLEANKDGIKMFELRKNELFFIFTCPVCKERTYILEAKDKLLRR